MKLLNKILIFWTLFIGLGAVWGAVSMFIDPTGVLFGYDFFFEGFKKLPFYELLFTNLVFPGISLLIVNGISQLATFVMIIKKRPAAARCALVCGILLMLWICIHFIIFPFNWLSTSYFLFGAAEAATALLLIKKERAA